MPLQACQAWLLLVAGLKHGTYCQPGGLEEMSAFVLTWQCMTHKEYCLMAAISPTLAAQRPRAQWQPMK